MPECNFFVRNGYCSNGDECLYLHIDPDSKLPACPHYDRGFCPLGPSCSKKHVRRTICKYYLAGFCPNGARQCKEGAHPKWPLQKLAPPSVRVKKDPEEERERARELRERDAEKEDERERLGGGRREWGGRGRGRFFRGRRGGGDR
jgi:cleavage and polyadenylation specificity factor subunit 4